MRIRRLLEAKVDEVLAVAQQSLEAESVKDFQTLEYQIGELEMVAREAFQAEFMDEYRPIVKKLENGDALTDKEREVVELLIVGEAKSYLKHEKDFENWKKELQQLTKQIGDLGSDGLGSIDDIMHLHALCRDVRDVLPEISFYLREKERVERFRKGTNGALDRESGKILAAMIKEMMVSADM